MTSLRIHEIPWPDGTMTYEVRTPGRGPADDYEPGECLAVLPTRKDAEAWIAIDQEGGIEQALNHAYAEGRKDEAEENGTASRLIGAWVAAHGKPIPWEKAVEIVAIVDKLPEAERLRLLAMNE